MTSHLGGGAKGVGKVQIRMEIWGDVHSSSRIGDPQLELLEVKSRNMLEKKLYFFRYVLSFKLLHKITTKGQGTYIG